MIETTILNTARDAFAAIDVSEENERIAELEAERGRIDSAIASAQARVAEISTELAEYAPADPAVAMADALLADASPTMAADAGLDREALVAERAKLNGATGELRRRQDDAYNEIRAVQGRAFHKVQGAAQPMIAALVADARAAAERIAANYAMLDAINGATRAGNVERNAVGLAAARVMASDGLIRRGPITVDSAIGAALRALQGKGPALPVGIREVAQVPDDNATAALIAGAVARLRPAA